MRIILRLFFIISRAFENSYRSVSAVRWKSLIAVSTIFIGALAITTTFTISSNVDGYIQYLIEINGGPRVTVINDGVEVHFSKNDIEKIQKVSIVKNVYGTDESGVSVRYLDSNLHLRLRAVTEENYKMLPLKLLKGSSVSLLDQKKSTNGIVLSRSAVKRLGFPLDIHDYVAVKVKGGDEILLKLIGIVDVTDQSYDSGFGWVNFPLYRDITGKKSLSELHIVSKDSNWMNWAEKFGKTVLEEKFGNNIWFINPLESFLEEKKRLWVFIEMGYILGFMALLAGSIGSTSVMILNINLRRREIGLYKAMGFSSFIVLIQFTLETLILSVFGGFAGSLIGSILGVFISRGMFPIGEFSLMGMSLGFGVAILTGLVFGLIPAFIASKLDPVSALQG